MLPANNNCTASTAKKRTRKTAKKVAKKVKVTPWDEVEKRYYTDEQIEARKQWAERETLEMNLQKLRKLFNITQKKLEAKINMPQCEISLLEKRKDHLVSTLKRYVEALGGELEVVARFDDKTIRLVGV